MDLDTEKLSLEHKLFEVRAYVRFFIKWVAAAVVTGLIAGVIGVFFHEALDFVTEYRENHSWIVLCMPIGGVSIVALYKLLKLQQNKGTNAIIEAARTGDKVSILLMPGIIIATIITQLVGGSAGREGAALQVGGSIGNAIGRMLKFNKKDIQIIVMSGMSAAFTALFGTPVTAAFFSMEVVAVGKMQYYSIIPCVISSATAFGVAQFFGAEPTHFDLAFVPQFGAVTVLQISVIAVCCAVLGIIFCKSLHFFGHNMKKMFKNNYIKILVGSAVVILLTYITGCGDYNGAGMSMVYKALSGEAKPYAFALKILFTAITLACGFRGGEIVPTLFIGSTFGCAMASWIGLDPGFGAAIGLVALFCSVVNCPVASVFLGVEMFGSEGILLYVTACGISYMLSGYSGLYGSQKFAYSKFKDKYINVSTK